MGNQYGNNYLEYPTSKSCACVVFVGAGLSVCGVLMQALTKNALADPYVLVVFLPELQQERYVPYTGCFHFAGGYGTMFGAICGAATEQLYYPWRLQHIREPLLRHS
ncbi:MAG: iron chelate uptake ABC transporter family permease subunit [Mediterraneibacter gnavus]